MSARLHKHRWLSMVACAALSIGATVLFSYARARGQGPPAWPNVATHLNTPCFGGNICYVCPQAGGVACTAAQPAAGYAQGACQVGYPATKTCWDTTWSCGAEINCATLVGTGQFCYNGPWCKN
jgi:hypothetical protein